STLTHAVPAAGKSLAAIVASNVVVLIERVGRFAPFHRTTEKVLNPLPITCSFNGPALARACVGFVALIAGAGLVTGTNVANARSSLMRGIVDPPKSRPSRI